MSEKSNVLPNSLEAEQALLGSMLIDNDILTETVEQLSESDFYQESHRYIISAMKMVFADRRPIDLVTICDKLEKTGTLEKAGGIAYVSELAQITPSSANYRYYFDIVKRDSTNRGLIRAAKDIIKYAQEGHDYADSLQTAESLIYNVARVNERGGIKDMREGDGLRNIMDKFQKIARDKDAYKGITTGITRLDEVTHGFQRTDLIVIAARPGGGKTSLAMNIVEHAALVCNAVCAVFSIEMSNEQLIQRLLCGAANVSMSKALSSKLEANDWRKLFKAQDELSKARVFIDELSITPSQILSQCRRIKAKNNGQLDLVMIDYIQLMRSDNKKDEGNRVTEIGEITRSLKLMAKELNVPVIALSQLRRPPQTSPNSAPQLSDLRDSGTIEQDADIVMFIHRKDRLSPDLVEKKGIKKGETDLIIAKHRNGESPTIPLRFKGEITKFVNPDPDDLTPPPEGRSTAPLRDFSEVPEEFVSYDDEEPPY